MAGQKKYRRADCVFRKEEVMKVLLFQDDKKVFAKSGVGRAMEHQKIALELAGVEITTDSKSEDFDIVHLNTINPQSYLLAKKSRKIGKKVVFHAHSTEEDFKNSFAFSNLIAPGFKKWLKKCYNLADILLTPTPYSKSLLENYGLRPPLIPISNGIDLGKFSKNLTKVKAFRDYFRLSKNDKVVISVGHYFERKGLSDFIEVARHFPKVKFIWFGHTSATLLTDSVKKSIRKKPENVILPGYIDGEIIQGAFAGADLFFFPSYEETEGIVVLEALASKCQVLVRDIDVYKGWLKREVNCLMAEDNEEFIEKIRAYLSGEIDSTVENGFKVAEERSLLKIGKQLKGIYEDLLNS